MIRVRAALVVVWVLWRDDAQAARHIQDVADADLLPRIAGCLPLGNRRRLVERVDALLDEDPHQGAAQALAHRPALERGRRRDVLSITLGDNPTLVGDDEGTGHGRGVECGLDRRLHFGHVHTRGRRTARQHVAHGPRRGLRIGHLRCDDRWLEEDVRLPDRQRHAALAGDVLRHPNRPIRHRHLDGLLLAINLRCPEPRALFIGRREVADVLRGEGRVEPGDKDRSAHDLRVARRVVLDLLARWRQVFGGQFEGFTAGDHRPQGGLPILRPEPDGDEPEDEDIGGECCLAHAAELYPKPQITDALRCAGLWHVAPPFERERWPTSPGRVE